MRQVDVVRGDNRRAVLLKGIRYGEKRGVFFVCRLLRKSGGGRTGLRRHFKYSVVYVHLRVGLSNCLIVSRRYSARSGSTSKILSLSE